MEYAVECNQLCKTYDARKKHRVEALRGLDLHIRLGECFGMLGPNGAGKTTAIEIMEGLLRPTTGEVKVLDQAWSYGAADGPIRQRIGISLQETRLSEKLTVLETISLFRSFYHQGYTPAEAIALVSMQDKTHARVGKLSGGQQQRLSVACALVGKPELLFLDEPTTGLDPQSRRQLWDVLKTQRDNGCTILITTHYMDEAERLCDRVAIVDHGQVIALGSPSELISKLGGEHVIEFALLEGRFDNSDAIGGLPSVIGMLTDGDGYALTVREPHVAIPAVLTTLSVLGLQLAKLTTRHVSLEDVFVSLTGRHLRDDTLSGSR